MSEIKILTNAYHISSNNELCKKTKNVLNSKDLIQAIKDRYSNLSHKGWEWQSFYNGALEGYVISRRTIDPDLVEAVELLKRLCDERLFADKLLYDIVGDAEKLLSRMEEKI